MRPMIFLLHTKLLMQEHGPEGQARGPLIVVTNGAGSVPGCKGAAEPSGK